MTLLDLDITRVSRPGSDYDFDVFVSGEWIASAKNNHGADEAAHEVTATAVAGEQLADIVGIDRTGVRHLDDNTILAEQFLEHFDGMSIGSNDLTQLTLGLDRDSSIVAHLFDERNPAVKKLLSMAIKSARAKGKYVGICGQGPSDHPDLAEWLMQEGIESVSLNPDTVVDTWLRLAKLKANG